mmetsp:Transcript_1098/g.2833  ORF Transcript_1098/g.2833 Transcript_1098/m.2833 type:complete len:98 (-) Transcript_1098:113-406(-)
MASQPTDEAPASGTVEELLAEIGEEATLGDLIRMIGEREKQRINSAAEEEIRRLGGVVAEQLRKQYSVSGVAALDPSSPAARCERRPASDPPRSAGP